MQVSDPTFVASPRPVVMLIPAFRDRAPALIDFRDRFLNLFLNINGPRQMVFTPHRNIEERQDCVATEVVDDAVLADNDIGAPSKELVDIRGDLLGPVLVDQRRETVYVGEKDGNLGDAAHLPVSGLNIAKIGVFEAAIHA